MSAEVMMGSGQKLVFDEAESRPGVYRADWHGGPFTVVRYRYAPGSVFPSHSHDSSQLTVVLSGRIRFVVDGREHELMPGESLFIPGGASHSAEVAGDAEVVSINVFHPPRKEHP